MDRVVHDAIHQKEIIDTNNYVTEHIVVKKEKNNYTIAIIVILSIYLILAIAYVCTNSQETKDMIGLIFSSTWFIIKIICCICIGMLILYSVSQNPFLFMVLN